MKLFSWNVNGLRAISSKAGFMPWFSSSDADLIAFQEVKARPDQLSDELLSPAGFSCTYITYPALKKGYSGVCTYSRRKPISVNYELSSTKWAQEGRLIHLEFNEFHFLNIYFPNGQRDDDRLEFKLGYYEEFLNYAQSLRKTRPIVVCGDFNTAHREIDLAFPEAFENTSGFLPVERAFLTKMIGLGYIDTFRAINGDAPGNYTWWSYRAGERARNEGWRIDYFFISNELEKNLVNAWIEPQVLGSDHCPIGLELKF
jgi:exodeoxyribonuclease-3